MMFNVTSSIATNEPLWWDIIIEEAVHLEGSGSLWEISLHSSLFCFKHKTILKKKKRSHKTEKQNTKPSLLPSFMFSLVVSHRALRHPLHAGFLCCAFFWFAKSLQSYLTLCNPMDCSLPSSSVHGILQTRILEWAAMPFSRESSPLRNRTRVSYIY